MYTYLGAHTRAPYLLWSIHHEHLSTHSAPRPAWPVRTLVDKAWAASLQPRRLRVVPGLSVSRRARRNPMWKFAVGLPCNRCADF